MLKLRGICLFILTCIVLTACSGSDGADEVAEEGGVSDEELVSVVETNVKMLMEKDLNGYMDTIHSESPVYESTEGTITDLFDYSLMIELSDVHVKDKSQKEAVVSYTQRTVDEEVSDFDNNETKGEHTLRLEDGDWKIYQSEVLSVKALSAEKGDAETEEVVKMEGEFADSFANLSMPFSEDDWKLASYEEGEGEARAEYIPEGENLGNYEQIVAYDFYENGNEFSGLANFISVMELSLEEMVTGELEFSRLLETESEVIYQFSVQGDATEPNQEEIGRIFVLENDLFIVRYTSVEEEIEVEEEIIDLLTEVG